MASDRELTPEAFIASCRRGRPTKHLHGWSAGQLADMVEELVAVRVAAAEVATRAEHEVVAEDCCPMCRLLAALGKGGRSDGQP